MERKTEKKEQKAHSKRKLIASASVTAVVLALVIGLSYAWFFNQSNIATLISISPPSPIAIKGPQGEALTALDLSYTDDNKDASGKVTIQRLISISSSADTHKLEIIHTTNLKGLEFKIYSVTELSKSSDGNYKYKISESPVSGSYINQSGETQGYKYANNTKHSQNYENYSNVQAHAEPLYWVTGSLSADSKTETNKDPETEENYLTHYMLEISWTEDTKETDIFYVLAKEG